MHNFLKWCRHKRAHKLQCILYVVFDNEKILNSLIRSKTPPQENSNFLNLHKKLPKICHGPPPPWKIFLIHTWTAFFNYYAVLISYKNFNTFIRHLVSCIVGTFFSQNFTKSGGCALYLGTIKFQLIFLSPNMEFTDQVLTIMSTTNHVPNNAQFMLAYTIDILDILLCGHLYQH